MNSNIDSVFHINLDMGVFNKHINKFISNIKTNINDITKIEIFNMSMNDYGHFLKLDTIDSLSETKIAPNQIITAHMLATQKLITNFWKDLMTPDAFHKWKKLRTLLSRTQNKLFTQFNT